MTDLRDIAASSRLRPLSRLGVLSPLTTLQTFTPGARALLHDAERSGEIALHAARALYIVVILTAILTWVRPPLPQMALGIAVLTAFWLLALRGLRSERAFTPVRYLLVLFDVWLVIDAIVVVRIEPLRELAERQAVNVAALPTEFFTSLVPPLLVFIALSSAFRLDVRAALMTALLSLASYLYFVAEYDVPGDVALPIGLLVAFAGILGTNAARAARYLLLKSQEAAVLETYVPEVLSRDLRSEGVLERTGRVEHVTLLLCDIRGFTRLSERLSPADTVTMVNAYLDAVCPPIAGAGGVVDKFMGDGVLAFFEGGGNASRAVNAARQVLAAVRRIELGGSAVRVGIALHSGQVLVGTVGPRTRREYTIISDAVNTVSRLEELNKVYGSSVVASAATVGELDEPERAGFEGPLEVAIRGRGATVSVYVLGASVPLGDQEDLDERLRTFVGRDEDEPTSA